MSTFDRYTSSWTFLLILGVKRKARYLTMTTTTRMKRSEELLKTRNVVEGGSGKSKRKRGTGGKESTRTTTSVRLHQIELMKALKHHGPHFQAAMSDATTPDLIQSRCGRNRKDSAAAAAGTRAASTATSAASASTPKRCTTTT